MQIDSYFSNPTVDNIQTAISAIKTASLNKAMTPLVTEQLETAFQGLFNKKSFAQTHIGAVSIKKEDSVTPIDLLTIQQFDMQDNSFQLGMNDFHFPVASKPKFTPVQVIYLDTFDWYYTKQLVKIYESFISKKTGLLLPKYKSNTIKLIHGEHERTYSRCAFTRPKENSYSPSPSALLFTFTFVYSAMVETYHQQTVPAVVEQEPPFQGDVKLILGSEGLSARGFII